MKGEVLKEAYPPEYFSDMAQIHIAEFLTLLDSIVQDQGASHWQLLESLPNWDKGMVGRRLHPEDFERHFGSDYRVFFNAFFNSRQGELLELEGEWKNLDDLFAKKPALLQEVLEEAAWELNATWHVQYATTLEMRSLMLGYKLPGTQVNVRGHGKPSPEEKTLGRSALQQLGRSSVCDLRWGPDNPHRLGPQNILMKQGKVLTWPQLFILGAHAGVTAQDIFATGSHFELIISQRQRSKASSDSVDAWKLKQGINHGW
jgi:hypothetical protein